MGKKETCNKLHTRKTVAVNDCGYRIGEDHPNARYTDGEIELVLSLRSEGLGYRKIAKMVEMPVSTVRDICKARRRCQSASNWKHVAVCVSECEAVEMAS